MVSILFKGNLGNNLFQYSIGRIIAEELGYNLRVEGIGGIPGFPKTYDNIGGKEFDSPLEVHGPWQDIDLNGAINNKSDRHIRVHGHFEKYDYYKPYKDRIKQWLVLDEKFTNDYDLDDDTLVVHMRLFGDDYNYKIHSPYYDRCIQRAGCSKVLICTDQPENPVLDHFKNEYGAEICNQHPPAVDLGIVEDGRTHSTHTGALRDFRVMLESKKLVMSRSTFSWWAGWLSKADEVYFPDSNTGLWGKTDPRPHMNINLDVDDEERYIYVPCDKEI